MKRLILILFVFQLYLIKAYNQEINYKETKLDTVSFFADNKSGEILYYPSGFYYEGFTMFFSPPPLYTLLVTIDGSNPVTSPTVKKITGFDHIYVHPENDTGRGTTPAFVIRASLQKDGESPSNPISRTYIFPEYVKTQKYPGWEWPADYKNGQVMDYEMSPEVTNNVRYKELIDDALLEIPTLSLTTDMSNLFNEDKGIYVNPGNRGMLWERTCNAELVYPDGREGFNINCGFRIRGGASRNKGNPKHSLRLFFREEYGSKVLNYPLFGDEGADVYYKVDLRTAQNYSWSGDNDENYLNTFVRDVYSRDVQGVMGQPYTRSRYYHLYIDGMYWGIYQTQERAEGHFAETYLGDDNSDYDVIKVSPQRYPYSTELADGNLSAWSGLYNTCEWGLYSAEQYYKLEGKDKNGNRIKGANVTVDIDNLIDYMILIFYSGNFDAPVSSFGGNKMPNNFYAIYNRKDKSKGFVFCAHDSEHSMMTVPVFVGEGLYENRVNIADRHDWLKMEVEGLYKFHPQWIHYKLSNVEEYRVRFADRAYHYLSEGGILTPDSVKTMILARAHEIDTAIIAESARWGDAKYHFRSRTKDEDWLPAINNLVNNFAVQRTAIVINQLKDKDLYPAIDAPKILRSEIVLNDGCYSITSDSLIKIEKPSSLGTIYYTTNGKDPRLTYGEINPDAISVDTNIVLNIQYSVELKVRIKNNDDWSALRTVSFLKTDEDYSNLKVTEVHYHPKGGGHTTGLIDSKDMEFIELKNIGDSIINISGLHIDSAVTYTVPQNTLLYPKQFYVIASKPEVLFDIYGWYPNGNFSGNLSNGGELVVISDPSDNKIISFLYDDHLPWPEEADGQGYSLVSVEIDPTGDPNMVDYWRKSLNYAGSPFLDDTLTAPLIEPLNIEEFVTTSLQVYPNPCHENLTIELSNVNNGPAYLELYGQDGRLVYNCEVHQRVHTLDFTSFSANGGIYILKIRTGKLMITKKVLYIP